MLFAAIMLMFALSGETPEAQKPAGKPEAQTQPTMDCSLFSMEGMRPGMTIDEIKANGIEVNAKTAFVPKEKKGKLYRFRGEKHNGTFTIDDAGTVKAISVDFFKGGLISIKADVDYDALVKILTERWGDPDSNESSSEDLHNAFNAVIGSRVFRTAGWENRPCRRAATVVYEKTLTTQFLAETLIVTVARDMTLAEMEAAAQEQEKKEKEAREKVKF